MATIQLQLDEQTLQRARELANSRQVTLEDLVRQVITQLGAVPAGDDPFLGMFSDEPDLIDQVAELAMKAREEHPLRENAGG